MVKEFALENNEVSAREKTTRMVLSIMNTVFKFLCELFKALYRDFRAIFLIVKLETKLKLLDKNDLVLADSFRKLVRKHPQKTCIAYYDQNWSYQDVSIFYR